ncbi:HNH endonuclease [Clostridium gasigenes]|uniref:HNH endonuclease n=1 Tax=Clostridium gasigenes TaxID=94869 RepID=UPI001C0D952D|nr:HNH endonuclease [Clostridium gasigenes]MBU3105832.1 HNH endonuclease [Clostridium gasigenes]
MILKILNDKYGLTLSHLANLFSKTEKALEEDLKSNNQLTILITEILSTPSKLLRVIEEGKDKIPTSIYNKVKAKLENEIVEQFSEVFTGKAFIKQVKSNELGFRKGLPGKAGSFILIPKTCLDMFPKLSETIENDRATINFIIEPEKELRSLEFIYNNSKIALNEDDGRDEYRLYNNNFINDNILLNPEDIIIIIKDSNNIFHLYRCAMGSDNYQSLLGLIVKYKNGRAFATMIPISELVLNKIFIEEVWNIDLENDKEELNSINEYDGSVKDKNQWNIKESDIEYLISQDIKDGDIEFVLRKIKQIKRDSRFRKAVLTAYNYKCAVSKKSIDYEGIYNIQACHIIGKAVGGSDNLTNGVALDMNLHWAFDNGMFTIDEQFRVVVHEELVNNEILSEINGVAIELPKNGNFHPSKDALEFHRKNVFGSFLK